MIIRKPYAFLIKNFKKIHVFLLILCAYIYYVTINTNSFVNEFLSLGTYDAYNEPISGYVTGLACFFLILIIAASVALIVLLRHKKKPWKLYLVILFEYTALFVAFIMIRSFFNSYTGGLETTGARAIRDILFILTIPQYPAFIILLMRIFGVDLNKFNFQMDQEYLELSNEDREEMEINIDIDKESIKRSIKRLLRNMGYVYQEHKRIVWTIILICLTITAYQAYNYIFVVNKAYQPGEVINTNGYTININNAYYTDKDYKGDVISKGDSFVILDMTIKNNAQKREINFNRFHLMNGVSNYSPTKRTYETYFQDFGKTYENKTIKQGEEISLLMIYKVSSQLDYQDFVLYYQEFNNNDSTYLRKIKLSLQDVSEIKDQEEKSLTQEITFVENNKNRRVILVNAQLLDTINYSRQTCQTNGCRLITENYTSPTGYKVLKLDYISNHFENKDLIDFSSKYGRINYVDSKDEEKSLAIENAIGKTYYGKYLYIKVPSEIETAKEITLEFTIRNNHYVYRIR